ncbi:MAG: protein TolQ [Pseudomonadota bacterium]
MTASSPPALATAIAAASLSPIKLFADADIVVQIVIAGLLLASVATWVIIISQWLKTKRASRDSERFEREFWKSDDAESFYRDNKDADLPAARVFSAGMYEWRRSTAKGQIDRGGTRERLATAMGAAVASEIDRLGDRLNILATVGSVAPFVGLFGTVWGIMRSFIGIKAAESASLSAVAPGISEALFATAIGLFAAIPAVIAYNRFSHGINRLEARLNRFADGLHATFSRELEADR